MSEIEIMSENQGQGMQSHCGGANGGHIGTGVPRPEENAHPPRTHLSPP